MIVWLLAHRPNWTYDINAKAVARALGDRFDVRVVYEEPNAAPEDVVLDFWWNGSARHPRLIRQVSSHRWTHVQYGTLTPETLASGHLADARGVIVPSVRLERLLSGLHPRVVRTPKGFDPDAFFDRGERSGPLTLGWAGKIKPDKGFPILHRASRGELSVACSLKYERMPAWYNSIDVIACASEAEGDPRTLIEGMACGCFPVTVDVGIVPELVRHGENGLIVERTTRAFAAAFQWCRDNVDYVRETGRRNAEQMLATRTWAHVVPQWARAIELIDPS